MKLALLCSIAIVSAGAIASPTEWEGLYTYGHEVNSFIPCGNHQDYWVTSSPETARQLREFVRQYTAEIYQPVYLRFRGQISGEKGDGFAADYDGLMHIETLLSLSEYAPIRCAPGQ